MFSLCCCLCLSCCPWNKVVMIMCQKPVFNPVLMENFTFLRPPFWFYHLNKSEHQWFISLPVLTGNLGLFVHHVQVNMVFIRLSNAVLLWTHWLTGKKEVWSLRPAVLPCKIRSHSCVWPVGKHEWMKYEASYIPAEILQHEVIFPSINSDFLHSLKQISRWWALKDECICYFPVSNIKYDAVHH